MVSMNNILWGFETQEEVGERVDKLIFSICVYFWLDFEYKL